MNDNRPNLAIGPMLGILTILGLVFCGGIGLLLILAILGIRPSFSPVSPAPPPVVAPAPPVAPQPMHVEKREQLPDQPQ